MGMRATIRLCALLWSVGGCGLTSGPALSGDAYALRSVAGEELPARHAPNPASASRVVLATLILGEGNIGEQRAVYEAPDTPRWTVTTAFTYVRSGSRLEVSFVCDDHASCIPPPHYVGTVTADEVVIEESNVSRVPLRFERVPPL
jgi:hypothetical protein